jgi:hypothetical protein
MPPRGEFKSCLLMGLPTDRDLTLIQPSYQRSEEGGENSRLGERSVVAEERRRSAWWSTAPSRRDRGFESTSLQRRVRNEPCGGCRRYPRADAGTQEEDRQDGRVLAADR